jgi:hypothetical protein
MKDRLCRLPLIAVLAAIVAPLGSAAPACAQDQPTEFQSWTIPGWTFTPGVVLGTLFDSNVAIAGPDVNGNTASDKLFQMEPFGLLEYRNPRTTFSGGYRGSLHRYFDLSALNSADHHAYVAWRERLTRRVLLFANEDYQQVASTDRLELNDLPFQRLGARHNALAAGVEARLSKSLDAMVRYDAGWVDFQRIDPTDPRTGGLVNGVRGTVTHRFTERLSFGGTYDIRRSDLNQGTRQQSFQDAGGVVRYRVAERTTVEASAGVSHLNDSSRAITRTGSFVKGSLVQRTQRITFGADYSRGYTPSFGFGGSTMSDELSGYVQMPLSRNRAYVQESMSWRRSQPIDPLEQERRSTWLHSVVGYALQRWLRLEGYYSFSRQNTLQPGGLIDRHLVGAQFVISEPVRIR